MSKDQTEQVLVIDLGTGGPKAGLVDRQGHVAACTSMPCQVFFLPGGGAEHDPAEWWTAIKTCVKQVLHDSRISTKDIIAVAVTSMWGVTVAVDERGEPLMRAMSWMDVRGAKYNRELVKGFPMVEGYQLSLLLKYLDKHGFPPSPTDPVGHMLWIKNEKPEIYKRTYKFLEPVDYINMKLTGRFTGTQNTVLPMLICDNRRLDRTEYDPWLVKTSTIDPAKFPELLPIDGIIGPLTDAAAKELGLEPGITVVCGLNDNSTSAVGGGSIGDAEPVVCMGNSGHMAFHLKSKKSDMPHTMCAIPSGIKNTYLFWGDLGNNAKVLDTCLKILLCAPDTLDTAPVPQDIYERADRIAALVPPGSGDVLFL
ncbi:MAG TPA: FGGY family carbohydrate kinase, partial [Anaerolineales bacterium]|nr:FGGY family carbohydrate kinase [Anaerolineales bacterium]